jgi:hypothetical protein
MFMDKHTLEIIWEGPFDWPSNESENLDFPTYPGIYLWTVDYYLGGYIIYAAGITRRPIEMRFQEHTRNIFRGVYTLFDLEALKHGHRKEIWHGLWMGKRPPKKEEEFERRKSELENVARKHLRTYRIFTAKVPVDDRVLERLEAAIMNNLYEQPNLFSKIPDRGMYLSPRWDTESPIAIKNECKVELHGITEHMSI